MVGNSDSMTMTKFSVGPIPEGLRKDVKPYAIPEGSFDVMINAIQWRGRVIRRLGYTKLARLSTDGGTTFPKLPVMGLRTKEDFGIGKQSLIAFDTQNAYSFNGTVFTTLASTMPVVWSGSDSQFFWTTNYAGSFWATNSKPGLNGFIVTLFANPVASTIQVTSAGNTFQVNDVVYFQNVTGAAAANNLRQGTVTVAGDPFTVTASDTLGAFTPGAASTGIALSTTRSVTGQDGIRFYGQLSNGTGWANYNPPIDTATSLAGALMIFAYRGYLVFLNTYEGNDSNINNLTNYPQRARWCQIGTPYYQSPQPVFPNTQPIDFLTMRSDIFGRGSFEDAQTNEVIVSAGFIRDILVVYFERSTWRLRYVNNAQDPFAWERVNQELGSQCTFSNIIFDKGLMSIGNRGIVISDSNDTSRFDEKIPDTIFDIRQKNNGLQRVYGIRTFRTKLNYWTFPSAQNPNGTYPDQVLVFNYESKNWSFYDDCFTCFGYYYPSKTTTWGDLTDRWESTSETWGGGQSELGYESIIAGNQQGYVLLMREPGGEDDSGAQNEPSLYISTINTGTSPGTFTSPNNNLLDGAWVTITGTGITSTDGVSIDGRNFKISNPTLDPNNFFLTEFEPETAPNASGSSYVYTISWKYLIPGSIQINIGALIFTDPDINGILVEASGLGSGKINYDTGILSLTFNPPIVSTAVIIRIVSFDQTQDIDIVNCSGAYVSGGEITKISGMDVRTKIFNFFNEDNRARLSYIDFYLDNTSNGQFTTNVFADSSNSIVNVPLNDNLESNIVLTSTNPYQIGQGDQTIYRLYADCLAQTLQCQFTLSDQQLAVNSINSSQIGLIAMIFAMRKGGRLV